MLKWTKSSDRSGEYYYLHTPLCTYEVRKSGKTKFKALVHGVWMYGHDTENAAIFACELDYASRVHSLAAANGYVKADDYEALKAKLAEVTDQLDGATDALDLIESEAHLFDATVIASGYVKLGDDEIVVKRGTLNALIDDHCADCTFGSVRIYDCDACDLKPIRDRLKNEVKP